MLHKSLHVRLKLVRSLENSIKKQTVNDLNYKSWSLHFPSENRSGWIYTVENSIVHPLFQFKILPQPMAAVICLTDCRWQETKSRNFGK
jgi:hypothetical protein